MSEFFKIFVIDDDPDTRALLTRQLETEDYIVETFPCAQAFLDIHTRNTWGGIILDVDMPGMDGPTLYAELQRRGSVLPVIFLSAYGTIPLAVSTIKTGAIDFLTKPADKATLLACVRKAFDKLESILAHSRESQFAASRLAELSEREREIMKLATSGYTSKEIALRLGISFRTVETHRAHIMQKTGAANLLELARIAETL